LASVAHAAVRHTGTIITFDRFVGWTLHYLFAASRVI
jgi:hypothetical protein